jgi:hypothetical protein
VKNEKAKKIEPARHNFKLYYLSINDITGDLLSTIKPKNQEYGMPIMGANHGRAGRAIALPEKNLVGLQYVLALPVFCYSTCQNDFVLSTLLCFLRKMNFKV